MKKNKHGVFGQIVAELAPKIPKPTQETEGAATSMSSNDAVSNDMQNAKGKSQSKNANKKTKTTSDKAEVSELQHEGLPVQPHNCKLET